MKGQFKSCKLDVEIVADRRSTLQKNHSELKGTEDGAEVR